MAKPTKNVRPLYVDNETLHAEQLKEVETLLIENKDNLKKVLDVLDLLDEHEVLNLMHASLKQSDQILTRLLKVIIENDFSDSFKNLLLLGELLGKIDMENVEEFALKVNQGIIDAAQYEENNPGGWPQLFSALTNKRFIEASNTMLEFVKAFGYTTSEIKEKQNIKENIHTFTPKPNSNNEVTSAKNKTSTTSSSKWISAAVGIGALVSVSTFIFKK